MIISSNEMSNSHSLLPISLSNMVGCKHDMSGCFDGHSIQIDRTHHVALLV